MKFSNVKQMVALTVCWAALVFGVDYVKNPKASGSMFSAKNVVVSKATKPHLSILMNHMCCSGCLSDVRDALAPLSWLGKVEMLKEAELLPQEQADMQANAPTNYGNQVEIDVTDVTKLDFVLLDRTLRDTGLLAERIEFSGAPHMRLEADVGHVCCGMCKMALTEGMDITKSLRGNGQHGTGQFGWLDSVTVNKEKKTVVAYARYDKTVNVSEFITALNQIGYSPRVLRVLVDNET